MAAGVISPRFFLIKVLIMLIIILPDSHCRVVCGENIRMQFITRPVFFKKVLPPLSDTEREATKPVMWEGKGVIPGGNLTGIPFVRYLAKPTLTAEEKDFIDNQVMTALTMIDDFDIVHNRKDLPPELWEYFKKERLGLF